MKSSWDAERVRSGLVAAFRATKGRGIYSPGKDILIDAFEGTAATWNLLGVTYHCLRCEKTARDREDRLMLLSWARVMSDEPGLASEASLREICRERGRDWSGFQRRVRAAAERCAEVMNVASAISWCVLDNFFLDYASNGNGHGSHSRENGRAGHPLTDQNRVPRI